MEYLVYTYLFIGLFAWLAWRDFFLAFTVFCALLPAYLLRFDLGPLPSTALEVMTIILLLCWVYEKGWKKQVWVEAWTRIRQSRFFWPGLLLLAAALISSIIAADRRAGLGIWRAYFLEPFFIYILAIDLVRSKAQWLQIFKALGCTAIALTVFAVYQYFTGQYLPTWEWTAAETRRSTSVFTSPNALAMFVVPVGLIFASLKRDRWSIAVVVAAIIAVFVGWSKGGMAAKAVGVIFLLYHLYSRRLAIAIGVVAMIAALTIPQVSQYLLFAAPSGQSRLALYEGSFELIKQSPILGTGLAGFGAAFEHVRPAEYTEKLIYPHNIFLNFWLETGLLGLIAVLWIIVLISQDFWRLTRRSGVDPLTVGLAAAFLAIFVHGLVDVPYFKNDLAMLTWLLLAAWYTTKYEKSDINSSANS